MALQSEGLADLANQEMQQELATVYLLQGQFQQGLSLLLKSQKSLKQPSNRFYILLAQAQNQSGDYLALANSLGRLLKQSDLLSDSQVKQLIAISYGSGDYHQCEKLLRLLITPLTISLVRGGGTIDGPLHFFLMELKIIQSRCWVAS